MRTTIASFALLCAVVTVMGAPVTAYAQEEIEGTWDVRWAQAVRVNNDGSVEIQKWGDAELELVVDGGDVTGRWTTNVLETVNWAVAGTFEGGRLRLVATEHDSANEELAIVSQLSFEARLIAGDLEGTVAMAIIGRDRNPARRPFTATRR